ncbi:endonuclease domain-containing 1 protein-like, partial [Silurus meridionalis]
MSSFYPGKWRDQLNSDCGSEEPGAVQGQHPSPMLIFNDKITIMEVNNNRNFYRNEMEIHHIMSVRNRGGIKSRVSEKERRVKDQQVLLQINISLHRSPPVIISQLLLNFNINFLQLVDRLQIHCHLSKMKLFVLVLLISAFSSLSLAEVVQNFAKSNCSEYFIKTPKGEVITPTVFTRNNYKQICQHFGDRHRYATLYDTNNRIPVYSAYTFVGDINNVRYEEWKNEPQLESSSYNDDMKKITDAEMDVYYNQAVNRDYAESQRHTIPPIVYTRGHVFPNQFASDQ